MADGGGSEAVRRYEGSPERQAAGNGGILTPFFLPSGMDSALSQLPPQEIILPFDEVLGMTMIVVFILAENRISRGDSCVRSSRDNPLCIIEGAG